MSKTNSFVEVNSVRYDAISGQIVNAGEKVRAASRASKKRMVDGFTISAHQTRQLKPKNFSKAKRLPAQNLHQKPQRAKTLMRGVVTKPGDSGAAPKAPKKHATSLNPIRDLRAKTVHKHQAVRRFGHFSPKPAQLDIVPAAVKPLPSSRQAEVLPSMTQLPSMVTSVSHRKLERMLDEALIRADAHKQMLNKKDAHGLLSRFKLLPRWLSISLICIAVFAIMFVVVMRNLPAVAVHVAAAKAGIHATLPAYTPIGFAYAKMAYQPGVISMEYDAKKTPAQKFILTQQNSDWTSQSLAANTLPNEANIETSDVNGTTVYIYGDHNDATWVNNNIRYNLTNQANLTSDQVLKIAQSL